MMNICLAVTPIWAVLALSRVLFYSVERLRFPEIVPPVSADAIQALMLWPLVMLGCHFILGAWKRAGLRWAVVLAISSALIFGALARPAYALATLVDPGSEVGQAWLDDFRQPAPGSWYPWLSNAVEYFVLYLSSVVAAAGVLSYRSLMNERLLRARVEATAAQERSRALRARVNPHFLFNALNSIVSLNAGQSVTAQHAITRLSDLLRRTLQASEREEHELGDELGYMEAYLHMEQIRQPSRIDWRIHVDAQCTEFLVPSLILLPLVENALTHGLGHDALRVQAEIDAGTRGRRLTIIVRNSCSAPKEFAGAGRPGLGLRNVRERLEVLFGEDAALEAHHRGLNCFEARISLPLRKSRDPLPRLEESV